MLNARQKQKFLENFASIRARNQGGTKMLHSLVNSSMQVFRPGPITSSFSIRRPSTNYPVIRRPHIGPPRRLNLSSGPQNRSYNAVALMDLRGGQGYLIFFFPKLGFRVAAVELSVYIFIF